jgi:hypothetical protein
MPLLEDLKAELLAAKATIEPQIEGLHDFARLNIKPETLEKVQAANTDFERRLALILAALSALDALATDKYPGVAQRDVIEAVYADLQDNVNTITVAFQKFTPIGEAVAATIVAGEPHDKP